MKRWHRQEHSVEIELVGRGMLIEGTKDDVDRTVVELMRAAGNSPRTMNAADLFAAGASVYAIAKTHKQYFEFSKEALQRLRAHGAIPTGDGHFRSFVMDAAKRFAGNLDWKPVNLGPEQALSIQTSATMLALRVAIDNVVEAIERVGQKVELVVSLARAERLGSAIGDRRTLRAALDLAMDSGVVTATDWAALAPMGSQIAREIDQLRSHVVMVLSDVKRAPLARTRAKAAEELSEKLLRESLALLVVAESNFALWQELRLRHTQKSEPQHLRAVVGDARAQLNAQLTADQELLGALAASAKLLAEPTGFEGLELGARGQLARLSGELEELVGWFASQRNLDRPGDSVAALPTLRESLGQTGRVLKHSGRAAGDAIVRRSRRQPIPDLGNDSGPATPALGTGLPPPHEEA